MRAKRIILLCLTVALFGTKARASSIILPDQAKMIEQSAVIATVDVQSITSYEKDGRLFTRISLRVLDGIKGANVGDTLFLTERGGKIGSRVEWLPGSPTYRVGEKATVVLDKKGELALRTSQMDLGKLPMPRQSQIDYSAPLSADKIDSATAWKNGLLQKIKELPRQPDSPTKRADIVTQAQSLLPSPFTESHEEFNFMGGKWRAPGTVKGDPVGDKTLGAESSIDILKRSIAPWVGSSGLKLEYAGEQSGKGFVCEPGKLLVSFNDPKDEIDDPVGCGGVLAVGGFCGGDTGADGFAEIVGGAIVFNNGWDACDFWNVNNVLEVGTHEAGHAVGLAHSCEQGQACNDQAKQSATMFWMAHFDGRGNGLMSYDKGAIVALYGSPGPTPASSPSPKPKPSPSPGGCNGGGPACMSILFLTIAGVILAGRREGR